MNSNNIFNQHTGVNFLCIGNKKKINIYTVTECIKTVTMSTFPVS